MFSTCERISSMINLLLFSSDYFCQFLLFHPVNFGAIRPENDLVSKSRHHQATDHKITPGTIRLSSCDKVIRPYRVMLESLAITI